MAGLVIDWMRLMLKENPAAPFTNYATSLVASWEKGEDKICRNAPHVILTHSPVAQPTAQTDCVIVLTYLELAAFSMGLGLAGLEF